MFGTRWRLFRLIGIPVSLDITWLIILALLTASMAGLFRERLPGMNPASYWWMGIITALAFFVCIVLHEMGHAVVARASGTPIRGITLFLFGGVAEMEEEPRSAGGEFLMAIAGPAVSAILAIGLGALALLGVEAGWPMWVTEPIRYLAGINVAVLIFNLLPAFPLDGGRVFRSLLWALMGNMRRATQWASYLGQAFAWLLIGFGVFLFLQGDILDGVWMGLIGMFLSSAARGSYRQVLARQVLHGEPVSRFMNPRPIVVPPSIDLQHWVDDYVYRYHRKTFPVASDGHLDGYISTQVLTQWPRGEWRDHTVGEVMGHNLQTVSVSPASDALDALGKMQRTGTSRLLVTEGDQLQGIVSLKDLLGFLQLKLELEQSGANGREVSGNGHAPHG